MNPNKALWEKGDFTRIAETMRESGSELVNKIGITKGLRVLDLGYHHIYTRHFLKSYSSPLIQLE